MTDRNITWQATKVEQSLRESLIGQRAATVWLTGLSASGKSTIAFELEKYLLQRGRMAYVLDGDNVCHGLCKELGFTEADRHENIRRIAEVARLMNDAGMIVISAFIFPYRQGRENARQIIGDARFVETHLDASLQVYEGRDPKGLYRRARAGEFKDCSGISAPYEAPERPQLRIDTGAVTAADSVGRIAAYLADHRFIATQ
jgi:adenylylsulfate kinase